MKDESKTRVGGPSSNRGELGPGRAVRDGICAAVRGWILLVVACGNSGTDAPPSEGLASSDDDDGAKGTTGDEGSEVETTSNPGASSGPGAPAETSGTQGDGLSSTGASGEADGAADLDGSGDGAPPGGDGLSSTGASGETEGATGLDGSGDGAPPEKCDAGSEDCRCAAGSCEQGLECIDDRCEVVGCVDDDFEPNETTLSPASLAPAQEREQLVYAAWTDAEDVDWYSVPILRQPSHDRFGYGISAIVISDQYPNLSESTVCVFARCPRGELVEGSSGEACGFAYSPNGDPGCCAQDIDWAEYGGWDCVGGRGSAEVLIGVANPGANFCTGYSLGYLRAP